MKKMVLGVLFVLAAVCIQAQSLSWEIKFFREETKEYIPITGRIQGKEGEAFRIYITPDSDCYCYVVCYDSERQIAVLFNEPMKEKKEVLILNMEIEGAGTDTLYVIMSRERQTGLESLIKAYNGSPNSQQNANNLYREVVNLQNKASELGEPASAFIAGGGTTRGGNNNQEFATSFSNKNLYVRPITIRH